MAQRKPLKTLRIGMIGAGFIARFHLESFTGVRNCAITGVYSPTKESRAALVARANELGLGPCTAHASLDKLIRAKDVDALWILSPNDTRVATMEAIHKAVKGGKRLQRRRLREAACAQPRRGPRHGPACRRRKARHRLSGEPGVLDRRRARQGDHLAPRRAAYRPALSRAGGRRNIPARTCPGSGRARSRAAACSPT